MYVSRLRALHARPVGQGHDIMRRHRFQFRIEIALLDDDQIIGVQIDVGLFILGRSANETE